MSNCYEYFVLVRSKISQTEQDSFLEKLEQVMDKNKVERVARDDWGKRQLAYLIGGEKEARYLLYHIKAQPAVIKELERNCRLDERVLRYLAVRVEELKPGFVPKPGDGRGERREKFFSDRPSRGYGGPRREGVPPRRSREG